MNVDYSLQLENFIKNFKKHSLPIEVNFRDLVPHVKSPERYTHLIHPYSC